MPISPPPHICYILFDFFFFNWRILALQCAGFCYTSTWISLLILLGCHVSFLQLSTILWTRPLSSNLLPSQIPSSRPFFHRACSIVEFMLNHSNLRVLQTQESFSARLAKAGNSVENLSICFMNQKNVKPHGELVWVSREERLFACLHSISIFTWLNCEADQVCLH